MERRLVGSAGFVTSEMQAAGREEIRKDVGDISHFYDFGGDAKR